MTTPTSTAPILNRHTLAILATTVMWGTFWIPLRQLDERGEGSIIFTGGGFLLPLLVLLPGFLRNIGTVWRAGWTVWLLGLTFGIAGTFYAEGALRGNVARVILLFYLTPVWSTLFARFMLGEPISRQRMLTLVLGLLGMYVILGGDSLFPLPQTDAEWLGLIAGISWGLAMVYTQRAKEVPTRDIATVIFIFFVLCFAALTLLPGGRHWHVSPALLDYTTVLWILAFAFLWNLPSVFLTVFGAVEIEPGKVAILLMLEVIIGISTAALLTNEPFGATEMLGAVLIISAGVVEFIPRKMESAA